MRSKSSTSNQTEGSAGSSVPSTPVSPPANAKLFPLPVSKPAAPKEPAAKEPAAKEPAPKELVSKGVAPKKPEPKELAPKAPEPVKNSHPPAVVTNKLEEKKPREVTPDNDRTVEVVTTPKKEPLRMKLSDIAPPTPKGQPTDLPVEILEPPPDYGDVDDEEWSPDQVPPAPTHPLAASNSQARASVKDVIAQMEQRSKVLPCDSPIPSSPLPNPPCSHPVVVAEEAAEMFPYKEVGDGVTKGSAPQEDENEVFKAGHEEEEVPPYKEVEGVAKSVMDSGRNSSEVCGILLSPLLAPPLHLTNLLLTHLTLTWMGHHLKQSYL